MIIFINEDEGYLRWIDQNPNGFVVNAARVPKPNYLVLHRATCAHVASDRRTNWTSNTYIKICSQSLDELRAWATRDVGGELQPCSFCNRQPVIDEPPILEVPEPPISLHPQATGFPVLWRREKELVVIEKLDPLKASWEKSTDVSQVRLREYRQAVRERIANSINHDQLYLDLHVALADSKKLLNGNDLENYLTPLFECGCLPAERFRLVAASKAVGGTSQLSIGTATEHDVSEKMNDFSHVSLPPFAKKSSDADWKNAIQTAFLASNVLPMPDGEAEVQIAWKCPLSRRNWCRLWKSTGDAMGPILGAYQRKNQFDPKDDRITELSFHFVPDESLGNAIALGFWWRMRPPTSSQLIPSASHS